MNERNWYDKSYKLFFVIPIVFLISCIIYLGIFVSENGDIVRKDVSLTGGTSISIFDKSLDIQKLKEDILKDYPDLRIREISDFSTSQSQGVIIESKAEAEKIKDYLEKYLGYELNSQNSSIEFTGSVLSEGFYKQLRTAIILAFLLMSIVVFIVFRSIVPSIAVILCAFADIVMTLSVVNLLGIELSLAGVIAFLMLIGYSVDTDILLTTRVLKTERHNPINSRLFGSFKTGITMTLTSAVAVGVSLFFVWGLSDTLSQIFIILSIGLFFDIVNTWMTNAAILKWYAERSERK